MQKDHSESRIIGSYRIIKKLGQGNMGIVFLAERADGQYQKKVAIKLIRSDRLDEGYLNRFNYERKILGSLQHPYIANITDAGTTDLDEPYFVMDYIDGRQIDQFCNKNQLNTEQKIRLFLKVLDAIQHAHDNLIIHRDIKPSNILVDQNGEPKLVDFGIAKDFTNIDQNLTQKESSVFTPKYASPEQISDRSLTVQSDLYSAGVVLYELLTGRYLYPTSSNSIELANSILESVPTRPSKFLENQYQNYDETIVTNRSDHPTASRRKVVSELKGDLDNICLMSLRKEPERRYSSVKAFSDDLQNYLDGLPVTAAKQSFLYIAKKQVLRNKLLFFALGIIILFGAYSAYLLLQERQHLQKITSQNQQVISYFSSFYEGIDPYQVNSGVLLAKDLLDSNFDRISTSFNNFPETRLSLLVQAAKVYSNLGKDAKSLKLIEQIEEMKSKGIIAEEVFYRNVYPLKAHVLIRLSKHDSAKEWLSLLSINEFKNLSPNQDDYFRLIFAHHDFHFNSADYKESLELLKKLQVAFGESNNTDIRLIYRHLVSLSSVHARLGNYQEALKDADRLLQFINQNSPNFDNRIGRAYFIKAGIQNKLGEYQASVSNYRKSLELNTKFFGEVHPFVSDSLNNLALNLEYIGENEEAFTLSQKNVELKEKIYGIEHRETAIAYNNLAIEYQNKGLVDQAINLYEKSLKINKKIYGEEHPEVAVAMMNLAPAFLNLGKKQQAVEYATKAFSIAQKRHSEEHPKTIAFGARLAKVKILAGNGKAGVDLANRLLKIVQEVLPKNHPESIYLSEVLSLGYKSLGNYKQALKSLQTVEIDFDSKTSRSTKQEIWNQMIDLALQMNRPQEAMRYADRVQSLFKSGMKSKALSQRLLRIAELSCRKGNLVTSKKAIEGARSLTEESEKSFQDRIEKLERTCKS